MAQSHTALRAILPRLATMGQQAGVALVVLINLPRLDSNGEANVVLHGLSTGTISLESFSETVFQFRITPFLALKEILFSVLVGLVGSCLPAMRALRLPVIVALKAV